MWPHFLNLLHQIWRDFLARQGTTGWGFMSNWMPSILSSLIAVAAIGILRGKQAVIDHWKQSLAIVICSAVAGNCLWFIPVMICTSVGTVYRDHQNLSARVASYRKPIQRSLLVSPQIRPSNPSELYILETNSSQNRTEVDVYCTVPIVDLSLMPLGANMASIDAPDLISPKRGSIILESPAWDPGHPLMVSVFLKQIPNTPGAHCSITAK
jgi:hypothetical protein